MNISVKILVRHQLFVVCHVHRSFHFNCVVLNTIFFYYYIRNVYPKIYFIYYKSFVTILLLKPWGLNISECFVFTSFEILEIVQFPSGCSPIYFNFSTVTGAILTIQRNIKRKLVSICWLFFKPKAQKYLIFLDFIFKVL